MTKKIKTLVSLLLVLCMVSGLTVSAYAAETSGFPSDGSVLSDEITEEYRKASFRTAGEEELYKIVHLDCGRKYFTPAQIKTVINTMAAAGFNQLQLYLSDNQGYRLALDNMEITTDYATYDLRQALGGGYSQPDKNMYPDGTDDYLTQSDMTEIIAYAGARGIEIVPCINVPGHMGAILEHFPDFRYSDSSGTSKSSIDLDNDEAVAFALAVTRLYAEYFSSEGCRFYNLGADEYANDIHENGFGALNTSGGYPKFVKFINDASGIVKENNMTPRVFNDGMYIDTSVSFDTDIQVCYWNNYNSTSASVVAQKGHAMINTHQEWYWVLGITADNGWHCSAERASRFDINTFKPNVTIDNPAGAMFCIWNDKADADTSENVIAETAPVITAFGGALPVIEHTVTDTVTGVAVKSASNLPQVTVTESSTPIEVPDAEEVRTYDVQVAASDGSTLNYAVSADITIPVPSEWQDTPGKIFAFFEKEDGTITKKWGSYSAESGTYTFKNVPVPSRLGIAKREDITVTQEKDIVLSIGESLTEVIKGADYTGSVDNTGFDSDIAGVAVQGYPASDVKTADLVTEISSGANYAIQSTRDSGFLNDTTKNSNKLTLQAVTATDAQTWKITSDGSAYTIQNAAGKYLSIGNGSAGLSDTKAALNVTYKSAADCWEIGTASGTAYYLNDFGQNQSQAAGWTSGADSDPGSKWTIYRITDPRETPETEVIFTGTKEGKTSLIVGNTRYHISVYRRIENITLEAGESAEFRDLTGSYLDGPIDSLNQSVATVERVPSQNESSYNQVTSITSGKRYLIAINNNYVVENTFSNNGDSAWTSAVGLLIRQKTIAASTAGLTDHLWTITAAEGGYYVQNKDNSYLTIAAQNNSITLSEDSPAILTVTQGNTFTFANGNYYMNNFGGSNRFASSWNNGNTGWTLYEYTAAGEGTDITFTAVSPGKTSVVIGGTLYNINVIVPDLTIHKYVARYPVWETDDETKTSVTTTVSVNDGENTEIREALLSEEGAELNSIVPPEGKCAYVSDTDIQTAVFQRGAVVDSSAGTSTEFSYLRYRNNNWQYSADRTNWTNMENTEEINAYYLIEKEVKLNVGESLMFRDMSGDYVNGPIDGPDPSVVSVARVSSQNEPSYNQATSITSGKQYLIVTNTNYVVKPAAHTAGNAWNATGLQIESKTIAASTEGLTDYLWTITAAEGGYHVQNSEGKYLAIAAQNNRVTLEDTEAVLTITQGQVFQFKNQNGSHYLNNLGGSNIIVSSYTGSAGWTLYEYTAAGAGTDITFTGAAQGETSVIIGGILYNITVNPPDLTIHKYVSSYPVWKAGDTTKTSVTETASVNEGAEPPIQAALLSEEGAELGSIVPADGECEYVNDTNVQDTVFWKGAVRHGEIQDGAEPSSTEFCYLRFHEKNWQYSADRNTWTNVESTDEINAYYLIDKKVTLKVGAEETLRDLSGNYADNPKEGLDETIAQVNLETANHVTSYNRVTSITSGKQYLIAVNGNYVIENTTSHGDGSWDADGLLVRQKTIAASTEGLTDHLWTITEAENGYYVQNQAGEYLTIAAQNNSITLSADSPAVLTVTQGDTFTFANGTYYMNNFDGSNRFASSWNNGNTGWTLYEGNRSENTDITIGGEKIGETSVIIGDTYYRINVVPEELTIHMFLSGNKVWDRKNTIASDKNPDHYTTVVKVSGNDDTYGEEGVALAGLVPETGDWQYGTDAAPTVFWKGVLLTSPYLQSSSKDSNYSMSGTEFKYIRYSKELDEWQYSADRKTWRGAIGTHEAVAYYLMKTEVTQEVTTYVSDWAFTPESNNPTGEDNRYQKVLSFAVVYEDGTMNPSEDDVYGKTLIYWDNLKDLGFISMVPKEGFEIEKITYTFGERAAGKETTAHWSTTKESINWEKMTDGDDEWYKETDCWNKSYGSEPHIRGEDLPEIAAGTAQSSNTKYDGSWGYNDAVLILIYVKPIENDKSLTVRYWDDTTGAEICNYVINVKDGTFLDGLKQTSEVKAGEFTLDDGCYIVNAEDVHRTISKNLLKIPSLFGKYASGMYKYEKADLSVDGKTLNLHYLLNQDAQHLYYVADFGLPMEIPFSDLVENTEAIESVEVEGIHDGIGKIEKTEQSFIFVPESVYIGPVVLNVKIKFKTNIGDGTDTGNGTDTGEDSATTCNVGIYPATTVYYEEGFANLSGEWENRGSKGTKIQETKPVKTEETADVYGYDSAYADNPEASGGTAATTSKKGAAAEFDFRGTGIDIYVNCTENTGKVVIQIKRKDNYTVKLAIVDTRTRSDLYPASNNTTQFGLPALSVNGLDYGDYTVKITNASDTRISLDGFRIYGTLENQNNSLYTKDHEHNPVFIELRDQILAAVQFGPDSSVSEVCDQVFSGSKDETVKEPKVILSSQEGTSLDSELLLTDGPKNELFLFPGQSAAFKLNTNSEVQVGLKAVKGSVNYTITDNQVNITGDNGAALNSSTDMFYKILEASAEPADHTITIQNNSGEILSITKIKICGDPSLPSTQLSTLTESDIAVAMAVMRGETIKAPDIEETKPEETESEEVKFEETKPEETQAYKENEVESDKDSSGNTGSESASADSAENWRTVTVSGGIYTNLGGNTAAYTAPENKNVRSVKVRNTITVSGKTIRVTKISANAFKNCRKLRTVTIGNNVIEIGKKTFLKCRNLKRIVIKSKVLEKVGAKAFKGISKKAKIKVPAAKLKAYRKLLKGKGQAKSVEIVSRK